MIHSLFQVIDIGIDTSRLGSRSPSTSSSSASLLKPGIRWSTVLGLHLLGRTRLTTKVRVHDGAVGHALRDERAVHRASLRRRGGPSR
jgi:hypothetical protein